MTIVRDDVPGLGPLGGLATALAAAAGRGVLVLAWDMPFVPAALLAAIRRRGETLGAAVMPVHGAEGRTEPLCAWYPPESLEACTRGCSPTASGARGALFEALPRTERMMDAALAAFGDPESMFTSVDTPERLEALGGSAGQLPG